MNEETKQILMAITELKVNVTHLSEQLKEVGNFTQTVVEATQSVKSAHNRIDDMKKDYDNKLESQQKDYEEKINDQKGNLKELKGHITWLWRAVGTSLIGFIFTLLAFFITRGH